MDIHLHLVYLCLVKESLSHEDYSEEEETAKKKKQRDHAKYKFRLTIYNVMYSVYSGGAVVWRLAPPTFNLKLGRLRLVSAVVLFP